MTRLALLVLVLAACGGPAQNQPPPAAPAAADPCPASVEQARQQGGMCLQPSVIPAETIAACGTYLADHGWQPDPLAEGAIGERVGEPVRCWRAPQP